MRIVVDYKIENT